MRGAVGGCAVLPKGCYAGLTVLQLLAAAPAAVFTSLVRVGDWLSVPVPMFVKSWATVPVRLLPPPRPCSNCWDSSCAASRSRTSALYAQLCN